MAKPKRLISIEEHFLPPGFETDTPDKIGKLSDFDTMRLEEMDRCGIDMQVLSVTATGVQMVADTKTATDMARKANDFAAEVVRKRPTRYQSFATIALQDPAAAADELERAVTQLGLKGAMVCNHTLGEYMDHDKYSPVWERAEALDMPIYIHPAPMVDNWHVFDGYPVLTRAMWGWGAETGGHALRIVINGVFDRYPKAKLILGHMGEMLPFMLWRIDSRFGNKVHARPLAKKPSQYIKDNILVTTSGVFSDEPLRCTIEALGADKIMFAVDYPYEDTKAATDWIVNANTTQENIEKVAHANVERVLRL